MMDGARKAIRRKPFGQCVSIEECPIDLLRGRAEHSVKPDGACGHEYLSFHLSLSRTAIPGIDTPGQKSGMFVVLLKSTLHNVGVIIVGIGFAYLGTVVDSV